MRGSQIEAAARTLLSEAGVHSPPVPIEQIARHLQAHIQPREFTDDISGIVYRDGTTSVIGVNPLHSHSRQRFTIAHELGHLVLHRNRPIIIEKALRWGARRDEVSSLGTHREEIEANRFAAALLMPDAWVVERVVQILDSTPALDESGLIARLADSQVFDVSEEAMRWRLVNLGILISGE